MNKTKELTSNDNLSITIRNRLTQQDYQELRASGLTDEAIFATGHFSIQDAQHAKKAIGIEHCGLVFNYLDPNRKPYLNSNGKPWYRIKPRDVKTLNKYDTPPKYLSQYKEGCRPYFSAILEDWNIISRRAKIPIWITEGEKKADVACSLGIACIGLGGVSAWRDKRGAEAPEGDEKPISAPLPELLEINWEGREVILAFDSDVTIKKSVQNELFELSKWLKEQGAFPYILLLPNELDGSKNGIDDFVVRHGEKALRELESVAFSAFNKKGALNLSSDPSLLVKITMVWVVFKDRWAYRPGMGWHHWSGTHWQSKDDGKNTQITRDLIKFIRKQGWESQTIDPFIQHLKSLLINENWNPAHLLVFENGTLDTKTNTFESTHKQEHWITSRLPFDYNPMADCPTWLTFLGQSLKSDTQSIDLLQAFFKWILLPKEPNEPFELEKALDLVGLPGTGKGTVLSVLKNLIGNENCGAVERSVYEGGAKLASLIDKKVSIDFDATGFIDNVGLLNKIISNEPLQLKRLWNDVYNGSLNTVLVRSYNRFLDVPSGSEGLDRRILVLKFDQIPEEPDPDLKRKLKAEIAGIFQWVWQLPPSECKRRLIWAGSVTSVVEASVERFEANNPEYGFLCELFPEGGNNEKPRELFQKYKKWCDDCGLKATRERKFFEAIQILGAQLSEKTYGYRFYKIPPMKKFDIVRHLRLIPKNASNPYQAMDREKGEIQKTTQSASNPCPEPIRGSGRNEAEKTSVENENDLTPEEAKSVADHVAGLIDSGVIKSGQVKESSLLDVLGDFTQNDKKVIWGLLSPDHKKVITSWVKPAAAAKPAVEKIDIAQLNDGGDGGFAAGETVALRKGFSGTGDRLVLKRYLGKTKWLAEANGLEKQVSTCDIKKVKDGEIVTVGEPSIFDAVTAPVATSIEETPQKSEEEVVEESAIADQPSPEMETLKAISLWQPWASLCTIVNPETGKPFKQFETRSWATDYRGKLIIHASKKDDVHLRHLTKELAQKLGVNLSNLPFGCAIAECDLVDCVEITKDFITGQSSTEISIGDWKVGRFAWKLENVRLINPPIPLTGHQKLWNINRADLTHAAANKQIESITEREAKTTLNLEPGDRVENKNGYPATFVRRTGSVTFIRYDGDSKECCVGFFDIKPLPPEKDPRTPALHLFNSLQEGVTLKALRHKDHRGFTNKKGIVSFTKERNGLFYAGVILTDESLPEEERKVVFNLSAVEVCK